MSELHDVIVALKGRVDELEAWAKRLKADADAVERENSTLRTNLALVQIENQELKEKFGSAPVEAYDPLQDLRDIGSRLDGLLGKPVESTLVISHDLASSVAEVNEDVPLDAALATPSTVADSTASPPTVDPVAEAAAATDAALANLNQVATET